MSEGDGERGRASNGGRVEVRRLGGGGRRGGGTDMSGSEAAEADVAVEEGRRGVEVARGAREGRAGPVKSSWPSVAEAEGGPAPDVGPGEL